MIFPLLPQTILHHFLVRMLNEFYWFNKEMANVLAWKTENVPMKGQSELWGALIPADGIYRYAAEHCSYKKISPEKPKDMFKATNMLLWICGFIHLSWPLRCNFFTTNGVRWQICGGRQQTFMSLNSLCTIHKSFHGHIFWFSGQNTCLIFSLDRKKNLS